MLGHWLRTRIVERKAKTNKERVWYIIAYLVVAASIGMALYFSSEMMQDHIKRLCYGYNSPILIFMSVLFFLIFTTFDFKSKVVNWMAGSVFAVYCIHEAYYFFRDEWYNFLEQQYLTNNGTFPIVLIGSCLLLFVLCILVDKVRELLTLPIIDPLNLTIHKGIGVCKRKLQIIKEKHFFNKRNV